MANSAIDLQASTADQPARTIDGIFPYRDEHFESRYALFRTAMDYLREAAVILDSFDLRVNLKWKKDPDKPLPPADQIKFPEIPRYVSEDVVKMLIREDYRQTPDYQRRVQEIKIRKPPQAPPEGYTPWRGWERERDERLRRAKGTQTESIPNPTKLHPGFCE